MSGNLQHGHSPAGKPTPTFKAWLNARARCQPNHPKAKDYYDRGIRVHPEWDCAGGFPGFLAEVGVRPSEKHSLDLIDNDLGYVPGNLRWVTRDIQIANRRSVDCLQDQLAECEYLLYQVTLELEALCDG